MMSGTPEYVLTRALGRSPTAQELADFEHTDRVEQARSRERDQKLYSDNAEGRRLRQERLEYAKVMLRGHNTVLAAYADAVDNPRKHRPKPEDVLDPGLTGEIYRRTYGLEPLVYNDDGDEPLLIALP